MLNHGPKNILWCHKNRDRKQQTWPLDKFIWLSEINQNMPEIISHVNDTDGLIVISNTGAVITCDKSYNHGKNVDTLCLIFKEKVTSLPSTQCWSKLGQKPYQIQHWWGRGKDYDKSKNLWLLLNHVMPPFSISVVSMGDSNKLDQVC